MYVPIVSNSGSLYRQKNYRLKEPHKLEDTSDVSSLETKTFIKKGHTWKMK